MRKSRRLLAMLLAVMMVISALPLGIFAEETATVQPEPEVGLYWCKYRGVSNNMPVYNADKASDSMQYYTDESVNAVFLFWNGVQFVLLKDKELSFPEGVEHQEMEGGFGGVSLSFPKALTGSIAFTNAEGTYTIDVEVKELSLPVAGFYGECNRSMDTWIGNGRDHVIEGTAKEMKTVYLLWDTEVLKEVSSVALSFEDASNEKDILNNAPLDADTADILAQHGITVTSMLAKGYLQVDTGFVDARNLEIFLTDEDGQTYSAHLSIDEVVSDEEEQPVGRAVDLYWSKFHGMSDGEPVYNADSANDHMWDEVGQDINAVFLFWDGNAFSEVPFEELSFPKGLTYSQNEEYANAVYMVFDKALVGDITYTKDGQTYAFPLEVEDLTGAEETLPAVAFYDEPVRSEDSWIKKEIISGFSDEIGQAWLMWDTDLFQVDDKGDVLVYLEKNEDEGTELEATIWTDAVDAQLANYGVTLALDVKNQYIEVTADFGKVDGTLDFALTLSDAKGEKAEAQLNIDMEEESAAGALKWCWVNRYSDGYEPQVEYLNEDIWAELGEEYCIAVYLCDGEQNVLIPYEDLVLKGKCFSAEAVEDDDNYLYFYADASGTGTIRYTESGVTYELPVTVGLPHLGFYTEPVKSDDTYAGQNLTYTGNGDVYYVMLRSDAAIQSVELMRQADTVGEDEIRVVIAEDGTYAELHLGENLQPDKTHNISVQYSNGYSSRSFRFKDARPGLRWCWVNGNHDNLEPQVDDLRTSLMREITPYGGSWMAFYFVENGKAQLLTEEDLTFPAMLKTEVINENEPGYLYVNFGQLGEGVITYEKDGKTYEMAVEVMLPATGFFNEPVRSEAAYAEPLVIDGKNEEGETVSQETFYLMVEEGWTITDIQPEEGDLSFFSWTVPEGENYAVVTMADGFTDEWYQIRICSEYTEIFGDETIKSTRDESRGFQVTDERPGLRWCWVERNNGECIPQIHELNQNLWADLGSNYHIAIYLCDGEQKTLIPFEKLGYQGNAFRLQALEDWESYINLTSETCGTGKITYEQDGYVYSLPVTVRLPSLGFYTSPEKSEENFVGTVLNYTGDDVYYAMLRWDSKIQRAEVLWEDEPVAEDEIRIDISDDGTYAILYLGKNVRENEHYDIFLYHDGGYSGRSFRVMDGRPGLKWCWVDQENGVYLPQTDQLESKLRLELSSGERAAVYFCDGQENTLLAFADLTYVVSDAYTVEPLEDSAYYFDVDARTCGTGAISYTDEQGETYTLPISVELPSVGIYSSDVRSEESYVGTRLSAANAHTDEDGTVCDIYYVLCEPGDKFSKAEVLWDGEPVDESEVRIELSEDGSFARLYLYEDVRMDSSYKLYMTWEGGGRWGRSFRVKDNRPGLRWVYLRWDDNDNLYEDMEDVRNDLDYSMNNSVRAAFYFVDGDKWERLSPDQLQFPDFLKLEQMEEHEDYVRVRFHQFGSGEVTYIRDGVTYTMPASVSLPSIGYYTQPVRSEATYMGDELKFDGKDHEGNATDTETFYLMMNGNWHINELEFTEGQPSFVSYEIVDGYAVITISEGFNDEWYEIKAYCQQKDNPNNTDWWWADFSVVDERPGLRWVYLIWDDNDNLYEDMEDVRSDLNYSMNNSVRAAFYFVDGDKWERLSPDQLQFPDFLKLEQMEEHEDYVRVRFHQFGSGEVTYTRDGVTYTMPASVGLPHIGYYNAPVRSEETFVGDTLPVDGKDHEGNATDTDTFYLMMNGNWHINELEFTESQPDFFSYEIVDGYAVITISKDFQEGWWEVKAHCHQKDNPNNTDWWWADFSVQDNRPGLKWKWVDFGGDGQFPFVPEDEEFQSIISHRVDSGVTVAVYYVDGDTEVLIPKKKLILPDFVEIEPNTDDEGGDYFFWLSFLAVGEGEITCADYPGCGLPVVSEPPFIALYSQPEAKEEYLLNSKNLSLDFSEEAEDGRRYATVYIVPAQEDWTLTGLQMGGNGNDTPMDFLEYTVNEAENYIELKVYDEYVPDWYSLKVYHTYPNGEAGDRWVEFRLADKPILQWMQVMEADGSYAITGGSRSLSLQPGESQLMAVCYTYNNEMVPLDYDDLIFPDFLSVERLDEDDPTLLRVLCTGLGEGSITSKTYPDLRLRVVSSREMLGYYTLPELNGDALNNRLNSVDGEDIVRWLIWDPDQLADVTDVTLTLKNEEHTILVDDVRASSADLSQWGITVTLDLEAGHMKLVAKEGDWYNLTAKVWQDEDYERITVNLNSDPNEWGHIWDDGLPVIWYEGVPYSFFITMGEEDMERIDDVGNFGSSGGGTHDSKLVIGAMGWYDTDKEEEAPEEVLNAIKNVQFRIGKFHNFDASGDQMECNFKEPETIECNLHGKTLHGIYTETYDGMYVYAEFIATFTVELPGMEPQTFTMNTIGHRLPDRSIDLDMTSLTTAEELNAVLSSDEALMAWVKANQPKVYAQFKALEAIEGRAMYASYDAVLAPVEFEDVIVLCTENTQLSLSGSVDDNGYRTTMPGMWLKQNKCGWVENIDFVEDTSKTMTWGKGKAFTCGILAGGEDNRHGEAYGVDNCTFTGFDYGIRCTEYSYTAPGRGCTFVDCEYGYYVDCGKKTGGNANSDVTQCRFINCGTAIRIKALPTYVSPYDLVISNNDFINNDWDIDLSVRGRFFFNGNYYGETADGSVPEVRDDCIYRTARVHGRGYATIIVNPRWQLPCTFSGPNKLVMDTHKGLNNYMINENADKNPIDSKTLAYDLGLYTEAELLRIIMTDDSENTLGTWTFSGTKDSESLSLLDAAAEADDTFNAELIFGEDAEGSTTVTIQDSSILSGGNVKLTVPCTFLDAKVTVDGREVDASVANGQVTFTVIGGGTYVIHEVELEEIEDAFITGGAAESNPDAGDEPVTQPKAEVDMGWYNYDHSETGEDTAPKFATVTTEDQQVAKEIDPDADLDQVVGDEKVEEKTETTQIVTVQAIYQAPAAAEPGDTVSDVVVLLVLYDKTGQMIAMHQQIAQQSDGTRVITVQCDAALLSSNAVTVKAFVISASGDMRPLAPVPFSQTLTFGAN